jgi:molybdopterin synthase catalytic subunit
MNRFELRPRPFSPGDALRWARAPGAGATVLFVGSVRPDRLRHGRVGALDYEAYTPLARRQMSRLFRALGRRRGVRTLVVLHRTGRVRVGEAAIAVVVQAEHRREAFQVARTLVDRLKREVPIWKKEVLEARSGRRRPRLPGPSRGRGAGSRRVPGRGPARR